MRGALLVLLLGCGEGGADADDTGDDAAADPCAEHPAVTWENFGAGFTTEHCRACHGAAAADRHGAPASAVFDTEADVLAHADAVWERVVVRGDMPPQGGVTEDERTLVEYWLGCGN